MYSFTRQGKHLPTSEKNFIHRYWSKKILADIGNESLQIEVKKKAPGYVDRTFPNRHQANYIQGLNRQNNCQHKSWNSRDCYFPTDIAQGFLQTLAVIFFYDRGCSFVRCCRKNLQCRPARFFRFSSTEVVFRPTPACFHLLGKESISPHRKKKTWLTYTDRKKC